MIRIQWGGHNNKKRTGKVAENSKDKKDSQDKYLNDGKRRKKCDRL